jgi:hypothetical protein
MLFCFNDNCHIKSDSVFIIVYNDSIADNGDSCYFFINWYCFPRFLTKRFEYSTRSFEDTRKALKKGMAHMEANIEKMLEEKN